MVKVTAQMVKELRSITGSGPLDVKNALEQANGDQQEALNYLREKGITSAVKKLSKNRTTNEGVVGVYCNDNSQFAILVEVNCETDFVATNHVFLDFVQNVVEHIVACCPVTITSDDNNETALMTQNFFKDKSKTIGHLLKETVAEVGEKILISRFKILDAPQGTIGVYQHFNKRVAAGVVVDQLRSTNISL